MKILLVSKTPGNIKLHTFQELVRSTNTMTRLEATINLYFSRLCCKISTTKMCTLKNLNITMKMRQNNTHRISARSTKTNQWLHSSCASVFITTKQLKRRKKVFECQIEPNK